MLRLYGDVSFGGMGLTGINDFCNFFETGFAADRNEKHPFFSNKNDSVMQFVPVVMSTSFAPVLCPRILNTSTTAEVHKLPQTSTFTCPCAGFGYT